MKLGETHSELNQAIIQIDMDLYKIINKYDSRIRLLQMKDLVSYNFDFYV